MSEDQKRDIENTVDRVVVRLLIWVALAIVIAWTASHFIDGYKKGMAAAYVKGQEKAAKQRVDTRTKPSNDIKKLMKAAEQGNAEAQFALSKCYAEGIIVGQDASEAVKWSTKAAEQGHEKAQKVLPGHQCLLGRCYAEGTGGVRKNSIEAVKWFKKAAEQGDAPAQYALGLCYYTGNGVRTDVEEAVRWFREAANQGHAGAHGELLRHRF